MSEHRAQLRWKRTSQDFTYESYNRAHEILFKDGAIVLPSSSAPEFRGDPERVDPEDLVLALADGELVVLFPGALYAGYEADVGTTVLAGSTAPRGASVLDLARAHLAPFGEANDGRKYDWCPTNGDVPAHAGDPMHSDKAERGSCERGKNADASDD